MAIFSRMPAAAILDPTLPDAARHVLSVIGIFADECGQAWPSIPTIAAGSGMSERTVQRHIRRLEMAGYITTRKARRSDGGWDRNMYQITYFEADVIRLVTAKMTPGGKRAGDSQDDTRGAIQADPGDILPGTLVTKSPALVTPRVSDEQPISNQPTQQPTVRAVARDGVTEDLKARTAALLAKQEAEQQAQRDRLAKIVARQVRP